MAVGLAAVTSSFIAGYAGAFAAPEPHDVPVAVLAPSALSRELSSSPALEVHPAATPGQVRRMIQERTVYGGLVLQERGVLRLEVAGGAGHSVAVALTSVATAVAERGGDRLIVEDVAPLSPRDPSGVVEFYCVVFLALGGSLGAMILGRVMGPVRDAGAAVGRVGLVAGYTALVAAAFAAVVDAGFAALTGAPGALFLVFWAYTAAICLAISGVAARLGAPVAVLIIVITVVLGNTSAGGPVGRPLLGSFYSSLTPFFPQGAGLVVVRGSVYFGGRGVAAGASTLAVWGGVGLVLLAAAAWRHRRPRLSTAGALPGAPTAAHARTSTAGGPPRPVSARPAAPEPDPVAPAGSEERGEARHARPMGPRLLGRWLRFTTSRRGPG